MYIASVNATYFTFCGNPASNVPTNVMMHMGSFTGANHPMYTYYTGSKMKVDPLVPALNSSNKLIASSSSLINFAIIELNFIIHLFNSFLSFCKCLLHFNSQRTAPGNTTTRQR